MKRAIKIGERLFRLGGDPTTKTAPINIGGSLKEMIELDLRAGNEITKVYRNIVDLAIKEEDKTTRSMCEEILAEQEGHKRIFMCARRLAIKKI